jgi:hypothetical protein
MGQPRFPREWRSFSIEGIVRKTASGIGIRVALTQGKGAIGMVLASHHSLIFFSARSDGRIALRRMVKRLSSRKIFPISPEIFKVCHAVTCRACCAIETRFSQSRAFPPQQSDDPGHS